MRTERVTKWMAAYILVLAMVFIGSQPLKVNATGANEELVWNQNYSATTRNGEINRYSFTLKEMGHIIVRFNTTAPVKLNMIDKKIHKEITHSTYMDAGDEISEYDLKAGDYEFQIVQQNAWEADVTFTAEFSPAEMTYTYANSMLVDVLDKEAIPFQRKISGYIAMNEDVDYYKLEVPARGIVNLSMDLKQAELLVAIHDEQDNEVYKGISVKMGTSNKYCTLDKGTYYLRFYSKIFLDSNYLSVGQYYFTASYKLASLEAAVVTKKSGTSFNVTAVNPGDISGYNIRYRKGNGLWKMVNVAGNDDLNKTISVAPNTYTVQVQTYCTVGDKTYYSDWSKEQKVTCKISTPSSVKVKNSSKNALKITAKKKGTIAGYQVRYRKGSGSWKNVTVKGNKNLSKTIKKLKKGSTYYVQVRAYCKLSGKNYYSNWSSKKKIKIKK